MTADLMVLDGGLATELERHGHDLSDDLWSARLLLEDPAAVVAAHLAYFRAGAQLATTASYQGSVEGFTRVGRSRAEAEGLLRRSVELAAEARDRHRAEVGDGRPLLVAASIGPYGAVLADGSEYTGAYGIGRAELTAFHRERTAVLADAGADVLAVETIPSAVEAEVLLEVLADLPVPDRSLPAWLSVTCADSRRTRSGEPAEAVFALAADVPRVVAVGVNCTAPEHVPALVGLAVAASGKPAVAYPNSGEVWDGAARRWTGEPGHGIGAEDVAAWVAVGARWVGGCCRVGPAEIATIAAAAQVIRESSADGSTRRAGASTRQGQAGT